MRQRGHKASSEQPNPLANSDEPVRFAYEPAGSALGGLPGAPFSASRLFPPARLRGGPAASSCEVGAASK
jgi:hypothetical protein